MNVYISTNIEFNCNGNKCGGCPTKNKKTNIIINSSCKFIPPIYFLLQVTYY